MSYSRLPVPTTARSSVGSTLHRSTINDGSNFGTVSKFSASSNFPGTVRKANLFTPQNKKISFPTGASTQSNRRQTVAPDRKYSKDPRPTNERDYQQMCFEKLVNFLSIHNYPHELPDAKRFFQTVSLTESVRIFEFLFNFYFFPPETPLKITHIEIDVPRALKQIGYPFTVTKSNLVSVASRQSIATLLGIFDWLVNVNEYGIALEKNSEIYPSDFSDDLDPSNINIKAELFKVITVADNEDEVDRLMRDLSDKVHGSEREVLEKEMELEGARDEEKRLLDQIRLTDERKLLMEKYQQQVNQDEIEIKQIEAENEQLDQGLFKDDEEIAVLEEDVKRKESEFHQIELEFQRLNQEIEFDSLKEREAHLSAEADTRERRVSEKERSSKEFRAERVRQRDKCRTQINQIKSHFAKYKENIYDESNELKCKLEPLVNEMGLKLNQFEVGFEAGAKYDPTMMSRCHSIFSEVPKLKNKYHGDLDEIRRSKEKVLQEAKGCLAKREQNIAEIYKNGDEIKARTKRIEFEAQNTIARLEEDNNETAISELEKSEINIKHSQQIEYESLQKERDERIKENKELSKKTDKESSDWAKSFHVQVHNKVLEYYSNISEPIEKLKDQLEQKAIDTREQKRAD